MTVIVLIPPLFGGAIADEKQKKTLHYLMASQLSSGEIVADKMLGRLPHLAVFLAMGLPIVSILGLIGGVPAEYVAVAFIGTASTAAFAAALTVLISTLARRVRQSVLTAYVLLLAWLFVPTFIDLTGSRLYAMQYQWISSANEWLVASSPFGVFHSHHAGAGVSVPFSEYRRGSVISNGWSLSSLVQRALLTAGRLAAAACFPPPGGNAGPPHLVWRCRSTWPPQALVRAARVRHRCRPLEGALLRPGGYLHQACALAGDRDRDLATGSCHRGRGGLGQIAVDVWRHGPQATRFARENLVWALRLDLGWYTAFWLLAVAGASASSVTLEREEDTWVSLTSTPLSGWQILRAKVSGPSGTSGASERSWCSSGCWLC